MSNYGRSRTSGLLVLILEAIAAVFYYMFHMQGVWGGSGGFLAGLLQGNFIFINLIILLFKLLVGHAAVAIFPTAVSALYVLGAIVGLAFFWLIFMPHFRAIRN